MLLAAFVAAALYTDQAPFCRTCHEMVPYNDAWATGAHADVQCIACHVEPGLPARFAHKFVALAEVWAHFFGNTKFPLAVPPDVPSARCVRCHDTVAATLESGFSHAAHAELGFCAECHYDTGHPVSDEALKDAGIFAEGVVPQRLAAELAKVGSGKANLPGHPKVSCSGCHDMKAVPCSACHQAPVRGHSFGSKDCASCHQAGGRSWEFSHLSVDEHNWRKIACTKCHPRSYASVYCSCHKGRPPSDD